MVSKGYEGERRRGARIKHTSCRPHLVKLPNNGLQRAQAGAQRVEVEGGGGRGERKNGWRAPRNGKRTHTKGVTALAPLNGRFNKKRLPQHGKVQVLFQGQLASDIVKAAGPRGVSGGHHNVVNSVVPLRHGSIVQPPVSGCQSGGQALPGGDGHCAELARVSARAGRPREGRFLHHCRGHVHVVAPQLAVLAVHSLVPVAVKIKAVRLIRVLLAAAEGGGSRGWRCAPSRPGCNHAFLVHGAHGVCLGLKKTAIGLKHASFAVCIGGAQRAALCHRVCGGMRPPRAPSIVLVGYVGAAVALCAAHGLRHCPSLRAAAAAQHLLLPLLAAAGRCQPGLQPQGGAIGQAPQRINPRSPAIGWAGRPGRP